VCLQTTVLAEGKPTPGWTHATGYAAMGKCP
jgi:hypothetical protein